MFCCPLKAEVFQKSFSRDINLFFLYQINMLSLLKKIIFFSYLRFHAGLLRLRGVKVGKNVKIVGQPRLYLRYGGKIVVEDNVNLTSSRFFSPLISRPMYLLSAGRNAVLELKEGCGISGCSILCLGYISIGRHTLIGHDTYITDYSNHVFSQNEGWASAANLSRTAQSVIIGDKCYIGSNCIITAGVTIGDNCVVAAGTVVRKDIPSGHMAYGNPAIIKPLPKRFGGPGRAKKKDDAK